MVILNEVKDPSQPAKWKRFLGKKRLGMACFFTVHLRIDLVYQGNKTI
jgi:hypothetical protein